MNLNLPLSDTENSELNSFLARVVDGQIPNTESLDGFFAALSCCPDLVMPSEYLPIIKSSTSDEGELIFEDMNEAERFMNLINRHWNHVNHQLDQNDVFLPLLLEDEDDCYFGNDWAKGFLAGTHLRHSIWVEFFDDEEHAGAMVPIWALAHENHLDPEMRPYKEPINDELREKLLIGAAAGVILIHRYFFDDRRANTSRTTTFIGTSGKTGRNDPCLCGSGKKFKKCCGRQSLLH
jgi:uncharacterized protein|tara:strand:- start:564 stop:1271 length:708 start_codon:yes stop_codon:yes gene_type:complete